MGDFMFFVKVKAVKILIRRELIRTVKKLNRDLLEEL